jgi:hypothetical protein
MKYQKSRTNNTIAIFANLHPIFFITIVLKEASMEIPAVYYTKAYTKPPQRKDRGKEKK